MKTFVTCEQCRITFKVDVNTIPESGRAGTCFNCGSILELAPWGGAELRRAPASGGSSPGLARWAVAVAVSLLLAMGVVGGRAYVSAQKSLVRVQSELADAAKVIDWERERVSSLERRHARLERLERRARQERDGARSEAARLRQARQAHARVVEGVRKENAELSARLRLLEGQVAPRAGCIEGDCVNGRGSWQAANGDRFVGDWKDGKRHGRGVIYTAAGDLYAGQWFLGRQLGMGTWRLKFANFMNDLEGPEGVEAQRLDRELKRLADEKAKLERAHAPDRRS